MLQASLSQEMNPSIRSLFVNLSNIFHFQFRILTNRQIYSIQISFCIISFAYNVGSTIVNPPPPPIFFFLGRGGVASQLLIFGPNSPHKSKRQIKTIQPQLNE